LKPGNDWAIDAGVVDPILIVQQTLELRPLSEKRQPTPPQTGETNTSQLTEIELPIESEREKK
jgi:hypothetical protein